MSGAAPSDGGVLDDASAMPSAGASRPRNANQGYWGLDGLASGFIQVVTALRVGRDVEAGAGRLLSVLRPFWVGTSLRHAQRAQRLGAGDPHELNSPAATATDAVGGALYLGTYAVLARSSGRSRTRAMITALIVSSAGRSLVSGLLARRAVATRTRAVRRSEPGDLDVVVPAYHAEARIADTVASLAATLQPLLGGGRIIVVDDGSGDETAANAEAAGASVRVHPRNRGKGAAVRTGFAASTSALVAFIDGDGAYDPALLFDFVVAAQDADVVIGVREVGAAGGRASLMRNLGSRVFNAATRVTLVEPRRDTQAGIKLVRREVADALASRGLIERFAFDVELLALCESRGWRVVEIPVAPRETDGSTVRFSTEVLRTLFDVLRVRFHQARGRYRA